MRVRSQLLVNYGAVLVIATAGLVLGLVSVLGLSQLNQRAIDDSVSTLDASTRMRAAIAQQALLLREPGLGTLVDHSRWHDEFERGLALARDHAGSDARAQRLLEQLDDDYQLLRNGGEPTTELLDGLRRDCAELASIALDQLRRAGTVGQARYVASILGLLGLATLLVGLLVSLHLARVISAPLEAMSRAARQMASGDFEVKLPQFGVREADTVATQFNDMALALRHFNALNIDKIIAEQRRSEAILSSIDDGLIICDHHGRIERMNPVAALQLGKTEAETVGRTLGEALERRELDALIRHGATPPETAEAPHEFSVDTGAHQRVLAYSMAPFQDVAEPGVVIVLRDVTMQREFDAIRTEFVLRASHELRTPLTSIQMAFGLLADGATFPPGSRNRELLDTIDEEMQRMLRLLNDLLDLSRLQSRSLQLQLEPLEAGELLTQAAQRFEHAAQDAGVELSQDCAEPGPMLRADRMHIDRVLDNLISNALRHTPEGGHVRLECQRRGDQVEICVIDDGDGIPYSQQARVFEPFVQIGRKVGGAGLGLAMCKEIVQQHGGQIGLRSAPGAGSAFTVRLPA